MELCEFCGTAIKPKETPFVLNDQIICTECYRVEYEKHAKIVVPQTSQQVEQVRTRYGESFVYLSDTSRYAAMRLGFYVGVGMMVLWALVAVVLFVLGVIFAHQNGGYTMPLR